MTTRPEVLLDKWPRLARVFFVLCAVVPALAADATAEHGDLRGAMIASLFSLLLASLYFAENRTLLDAERKELFIRFRWTFWRSDRRVALATVAQVYLRRLGKGHEVGLKLTDGAELPLSQPMGSGSDRQDFARHIAQQLGVTLIEIPFSDQPRTNSQLAWMNLTLTAFAAAFGFVAWIAATRPATDGRMAWSAVWICGGVAALILIATWYTTIREIRRRRKG